MSHNEFDFKSEIAKFEEKYGDLKIDRSLFESEKGRKVIFHFLEEYSGLSNLLIKNFTFVPYVYPYIEFSHKKDSTLEQTYTLIAQDFQEFNR